MRTEAELRAKSLSDKIFGVLTEHANFADNDLAREFAETLCRSQVNEIAVLAIEEIHEYSTLDRSIHWGKVKQILKEWK